MSSNVVVNEKHWGPELLVNVKNYILYIISDVTVNR